MFLRNYPNKTVNCTFIYLRAKPKMAIQCNQPNDANDQVKSELYDINKSRLKAPVISRIRNKNVEYFEFKMGEKVLSEFEFAPLRTLDDFLLESARFQIPNLKDLEKWGNRVCKNLLYYQTNYFLLAVITFIVVGVMHPTKMAYGVLVTLLIILVLYVIRDKPGLNHFKRKHPIVSVVMVLISGYLVTYMLGSLLIFFVGILLPFCIIFIHASLRLRNLRNKITNHVEMLGLKKTPMGIFLEELGVEQF